MTEDEVLKNLFQSRKDNGTAVLQWAEVVSVNKAEKTMDVKALSDGLEIYDVQLGSGSVILYPKIGTMCLIGMLENLDTDAMLISAKEVDSMEITAGTEIIINGGSNGGVININELTDKINAFVDKYNGHTHVVSTTGSATAQSGTAATTTSVANKLDKKDYEDVKLKH